MRRFSVHVHRVETYADIVVEARTAHEAQVKALRLVNDADWKVSDGNLIDPDDCTVGDVEEVRPVWASVERAPGEWIVTLDGAHHGGAGPWATKAQADDALGYLAWVHGGGSAD